MTERPDYPKTNMAILTRKTGNDGSYFVGYAGMMMVTLTKLPKPDDDGNEVWMLKTSNPPKRDVGAAERRRSHDEPARQPNSARRQNEQSFDKRDSDIPF